MRLLLDFVLDLLLVLLAAYLGSILGVLIYAWPSEGFHVRLAPPFHLVAMAVMALYIPPLRLVECAALLLVAGWIIFRPARFRWLVPLIVLVLFAVLGWGVWRAWRTG